MSRRFPLGLRTGPNRSVGGDLLCQAVAREIFSLDFDQRRRNMPAFDLVKALRALKMLVKEGLRGQAVRNNVLENANNLNYAILLA